MIVLVLYEVDFISILVAATLSMAAPEPPTNLSATHNPKNQPLVDIRLIILKQNKIQSPQPIVNCSYYKSVNAQCKKAVEHYITRVLM